MRNVLTIDRDPPLRKVVVALQERKQGGFSSAGGTDEASASPRSYLKIEVLEYLSPTGISEAHILEPDGSFTGGQRSRARKIVNLVGDKKRRKGFGKSCHMLGDINKCHG